MFKNWRAIKDIPDRHFMWAIALLDLATEFGKQIAAKFPEYFQLEQPAENGPIPLSVIIQRAEEEAEDGGGSDGSARLHPVIYDATHDLTVIDFRGKDDNESDYSFLPDVVAEQLEGDLYVGKEVEWEGKKLVMLEYYYEHYCDTTPVTIRIYHFAPAEQVIVDMTIPYEH